MLLTFRLLVFEFCIACIIHSDLKRKNLTTSEKIVSGKHLWSENPRTGLPDSPAVGLTAKPARIKETSYFHILSHICTLITSVSQAGFISPFHKLEN